MDQNSRLTIRLEQAAQVCLAGVLFIPLAYLPQINSAHALPKTLLLQGLALPLGLLWLASRLTAGAHRDDRYVYASLTLFACIFVVSTVLSSDRAISVAGSYGRHEGLTTWLSYLIVFGAASRFMTNKTAVMHLLKLFALISLLISVVAIYQYLTFGDGARAHGSLENPALLGSVLVMSLPILIVLLLTVVDRSRLLSMVGTVAGVLALYFSFGRGAWLAAAFAIPMATIGSFWVSRKGLPQLAIVALATAGIILTLTIMTGPGRSAGSYGLARLESATDLAGGTTATRLEMWKGTIPLITARPFIGWGAETFRENFLGTEKLAALENVYQRADRPHNHLLYLIFATGLLGAAAYYFFVIRLLWTALSHPFARTSETGPIIWGLAAALVGYQIQAEFLFSSVQVSPVWWLLAGLLTTSIKEPLSHDTRATRTRQDLWPALLFWIGAAALAGLSVWSGRLIYADYHFKHGVPGIETGATEEIRELETAARVNPKSRVYRLALGHAYLANGKRTGDHRMVDRAIQTYSEAIEKHPDDEFYYSLGDALSYAGLQDRSRLEAALAAYEQSAILRPYFPYTYWEMGRIHAQKGDFKQAITLYKRSLELDPANAAAYADLGLAHEKIGDTSKAISNYRKTLEINPDFAPAARSLEKLNPPARQSIE